MGDITKCREFSMTKLVESNNMEDWVRLRKMMLK
jgi:hypothetical protein